VSRCDIFHFLMLTLPCLVLDIIAPDVTQYSMCITFIYSDLHCIYQVYELNKKIRAVSKDRYSPPFNVSQVVDPSTKLWNEIC
jgi:hypothetical protein